MSTFAVTSTGQVLDSVNYLLSNLPLGNATGNITVPDGTLVANVTTGAITPFNVPGGTVYSYLNQYINLRYSNNASGTDGFSTVPTNFNYFGIHNSATPTPSSNPAAYQWQQVAGGFGTTRTIYYSSLGGRQVQWAAASSPPSSNFVISVANVAIDLDVVTTAAGTPGERGPIAMAYVVTTADPNTATSATLTGWFSAARDNLAPPIGTGLTPVAGDTATFIWGAGAGTPSGTFEYNGSVWNSVVPQVISGNVLVANSTPGTAILEASISGSKIGVNTIANTNIQTDAITADRIAGNTITGNKIAANTITGNLITVGTLTGNLIAANTITGNTIQVGTITANNIAANTITATQISSAYIYAGNIVSQTANIGNVSSPGYWLRYTDGAARFGGNVSIGNNASIGGNLTVTGLISSGALQSNTVATVTVQPSAISTAASYNTLTVSSRPTPGFNTWIYDTTTVSVITQQANQPVYLFGTIQNEVRTTQIFTPPRIWSLTYDIGLFRKVGLTYTQVGDYQRYTLTNQASTVANSPIEVTPFVGYLDIPVAIGTYEYAYGMRYVAASNVSIPSFEFETRNILAQLLKR